ncbi:hypothetical protein Pan216_20890 [Planctomycetes bacterium Pan216]|uniref:Uncharacterized protein n=1 Tax=Kolteria novifilia TaxID=2527975 RepID=A0A518B2N7_9BACT|nr:hypothetical protein Pan216_20890 [Planctomycetes bacterium Pan216]
MTKESTANDAARIKAIRDAAQADSEKLIPRPLVDLLIVREVPAEEAAGLIDDYRRQGYVYARGQLIGTPPKEEPTVAPEPQEPTGDDE